MGGGGLWGVGKEARDLTEEGMRGGCRHGDESPWKQRFFQTDRQAGGQTGTWGLTAEYVNMKGVCGYETAATTPTHTHTVICSVLYMEEWYW